MANTEIERQLLALAEENDLSYVSFDLHLAEHRSFYSCKGHRGHLAKSGHGSTIGIAINAMLESEFLDTKAYREAETSNG